MRQKRSGTTIVLILIILVLAGVLVYEHWPKSTYTSDASTPAVTSHPSQTAPAVSTGTTASTPAWQTFSDPDFSIQYPSYMSIAADSARAELDKNPTALFFHDIHFTPDPNADFTTFSASIEADADQDFVLNLSDRFVSYDPSTKTWYADTDLDDKPNASHSDYRNLYSAGDKFSPTLYATTASGLPVYGPFSLGDSDRGSSDYLVPISADHVVVDLKVTFDGDALSGSSQAIQDLKATFDSDLPVILKSVSASS